MREILISIADDSYLFSSLLANSINSHEGFKTLFIADNGLDLITKLKDIGKPDIIIMDISMPIMNGMEATKLVKSIYPEIKIIIQTLYADRPFFEELMRNNVEGYIIKNARINDLHRAIEIVYEGDTFYQIDSIVDSTRSETQAYILNHNINTQYQFTKREQDVLRLLFKTLSSKEISKKLSISERTVETHRNNMIKKTNSKNTLDLVFKVFLR